ncbi:MAG: hypothetical protein IJH20_05535 [Bacilli bacterium]|nr:hypothetical protein [Bacilli bacterium]
MKKRVFIFIIMVLPLLCLIVLDFINITKYFPFTKSYDWLSFFGAYISGLCTLILGIVSIKQNNTLSNLNKKMLNNDVVSSSFSKIDVENEHFYEKVPLLPLDKAYGIIMKENWNNKNDTNYHRFII